MNDKCLCSLFTLLHNVRMARRPTQGSHKGCSVVISSRKYTLCAAPRPSNALEPKMLQLGITLCRASPSEELLHNAQCTWALGRDLMHMCLSSAQCDKGEKCRCRINTTRSGQSMQPYYLHSYASIASLFTGKEMHFASEMHHEHRGATV